MMTNADLREKAEAATPDIVERLNTMADTLEDGRVIKFGTDVALMRVCAAELTALRAKVKAQAEEYTALNRLCNDRACMLTVARNMLGPKGLEVFKHLDDKGVTSFHISWGSEAAKMTGEERAETALGMLERLKTATPVSFVDSKSRRAAQEASDE